jgi:hypothetical protein
MAQTQTQPETPLIPQSSPELANVRSQNRKTEPTTSRIFLTGVCCVGKTAIGAQLADLLGYRFYDLDHEVEAFYKLPIERLQRQHESMNDFRIAAAEVFEHILLDPNRSRDSRLLLFCKPTRVAATGWRLSRLRPISPRRPSAHVCRFRSGHCQRPRTSENDDVHNALFCDDLRILNETSMNTFRKSCGLAV